MINPEEHTAILKSLGIKPIQKIQKYLVLHNITFKKKELYSDDMITEILSGKTENITIENAIFTVSYQHLMKNEKKQGALGILVDNQKEEFE